MTLETFKYCCQILSLYWKSCFCT